MATENPAPTFTPTSQPAGTSPPRFNVPGVLGLLYGIIKPAAFPGILEQVQQENPRLDFTGVQVVPDQRRPMSSVGTPIFYPITLKGGTYKAYDSDGKVQQVRLNDLRLPPTAVVEMRRAKEMTSTPVVASRSSIKEHYALRDWQLRISGILLDEPNQPQGATTFEVMEERLRQFFELADSVEIDGDLFHSRGIFRIAMVDLSLNQIPTKDRLHGFQIEAYSDDPLELIIQ